MVPHTQLLEPFLPSLLLLLGYVLQAGWPASFRQVSCLHLPSCYGSATAYSHLPLFPMVSGTALRPGKLTSFCFGVLRQASSVWQPWLSWNLLCMPACLCLSAGTTGVCHHRCAEASIFTLWVTSPAQELSSPRSIFFSFRTVYSSQ